ncbi:hypothetical protein TVAG_437830 [Trichomonas vaginalis G3]|uniref:Protein RER1 n=1 Tax=Trichomonas vaginalis (strain ATCC PRA-98 / G3) TaxID=412133 RepID=A2FCE5_TRIV3|nr:retrograde vesicle-mediated transport, Golgi to ER [Trichomonas vaginalis G3]EAX97405.1 hypothetical protein TVAG_437830 [Trichomonas vaginalis G3]KAI5516872.1 retrograde vesicle-mediated transport, Golgi to ER [Trichomonas vaginalis G3]|eukprot:XP_001310335.1 hypothetical protein [Trichomonas vaginalis G3]
MDKTEITFTDKIVIDKQEALMRFESLLYQIKPYLWQRWCAFGFMMFLFLLRVFTWHAYYYIVYIIGLYLLSCVVEFISPKRDPELYGEEVLPSAKDGDYKPFVRRLPEFQFWCCCMPASVLACFFSLMPFDLPVYAPLLFVYFIVVSVFVFRKRIMHMIKYKYVPWDTGKQKYQRPTE